ncbi:sodium:solute symporter family transporter [Pontiella sulfatireligans]|uniref:Sodium/glucose cotransporter n=1 Tax=Pontiella sulfatireligans TaxID=2750658 RepID=A0A6C2URT8_9BACT|nr:sodium/solute symporter [Pontiella sulfatireligans]VGO21937.1 Sodium/glucose cotransporter [Pontiella sulfatireligans]
MQFTFTAFDVGVFIAFFAVVIGVSLWKGRNENDSASYFLAGRGLSWWIIGLSLIAANISSEQFVGMIGSGASPVGLAIASYAWLATPALVMIAFTFLPMFLKAGVYTVPEYLEYRYTPLARTLMAVSMVIMYAFVTITAVTYSGAMTMETLFAGKSLFGLPLNIQVCSVLIAVMAGIYVTFGGLKACAWADLIQGAALIIGGLAIAWFAFDTLGDTPVAELTSASASVPSLADGDSGVTKFFALNKDKLHLFLPRTDSTIPWTALVIGLWIPQFYYWGLNQFIVQKTFASKSLAEGQKGVVTAGVIHVVSPLFIVIPGLIAFNLFSSDMADAAAQDEQFVKVNTELISEFDAVKDRAESVIVFEMDGGWIQRNSEKAAEIEGYNQQVLARVDTPETRHLVGYKYDTAFPLLIRKLVPTGVRGFMLAAILGAIISSLAAMLNSASSIFTMDIFKKYMSKNASEKQLVLVGRGAVVVMTLIACWLAPKLSDPNFGGIFKFMQLFQGYVSPGILAAFVFGYFVRKAPPVCGVVALLGSPILYGLLEVIAPGVSFLDRMAISFALVLLTMGAITLIRPLSQPIELPVSAEVDLTPSRGAKITGIAMVASIIAIYIIFR